MQSQHSRPQIDVSLSEGAASPNSSQDEGVSVYECHTHAHTKTHATGELDLFGCDIILLHACLTYNNTQEVVSCTRETGFSLLMMCTLQKENVYVRQLLSVSSSPLKGTRWISKYFLCACLLSTV